ncbi:endonuclease/exonuclease/phosphatase family metal-dependent hydrolase [Propionibacteriaceae bacterium ES.041]|uniref:endonuclease/exonuclease/phosphatase family protein n=1 Tax=Enemella evansiae TaxID=2016499 RepID=UPI000BF76683|nr:endonuclease/exonuclease/phosphatase family protein [Enemella evansiae]PFG66026.1 endonuclease/exonuclease/phosphatase family metal-dependent hydrolase [Propionibacteriaceae bacterium ES.041]TDO85319.1 endonuclease/exonuclease/phosphatase family metal-dependent hydrolase [Enemella evansiae]
MRLVTTLVLSLALLLGLGGFSTAVDAAPRKDFQLTVLSYNIKHGVGEDGRLDLARIAEEIRASGADVVGLQEVDRYWGERSDWADQGAELARLLGYQLAYGANLDEAPPEGRTERRQYGTAILSRYPIVASENVPLTSIPYPTRPTEQRGLLTATINVRGAFVQVWNTHLDHQRSEQRISQVREILSRLDDPARPTVLTGDLNAIPDTPEMELLRTRFADTFRELGRDDAYTYPTNAPDRRIDYVLHAGPIRTLSGELRTAQYSDHLGVLARLQIQTTPGR